MTYMFICPECGKSVEIQMSASEYVSDGHICDCGAELKRDIDDFCSNSKRNIEGFFGVSK